MSDQDKTGFQKILEEAQQNQSAVSDQETKEGANVDEYLNLIKNEKGEPKYSSVEDALNALKSSQEHISTLENENAQLRSSVKEAMTVEEIMAQLDSTKNKTGDNQNSFSMEDIKSLVTQTLAENERAKTAQSNVAKVQEKLASLYGEKAHSEYENKAKQLGLTPEVMNELASFSPEAVLAYFGTTKGESTSKTIQSSVNTDKFQDYNVAPKKPDTIMYGASTKAMADAWRAHSVQQN